MSHNEPEHQRLISINLQFTALHSELSQLESYVLKKVRKYLKRVDTCCIDQIVRMIVHKNLSETRLMMSIFLYFINTDTLQSTKYKVVGQYLVRSQEGNGHPHTELMLERIPEHTRTKRWVKKSLFYSPLQKKKIPRLEKSNNSLWCDSRKC